jgi:hypothetical protein
VICIKEIMSMHKREQEPLVEYYNRFNDAIDRLDMTFGLFYPTVMVSADKRTIMSQEKKVEEVRQIFNTQLFMQSCHRGFKPFLRALAKDFFIGASGLSHESG